MPQAKVIIQRVDLFGALTPLHGYKMQCKQTIRQAQPLAPVEECVKSIRVPYAIRCKSPDSGSQLIESQYAWWSRGLCELRFHKRVEQVGVGCLFTLTQMSFNAEQSSGGHEE